MLSLRVGFLIYTVLSVVLVCVSSQQLSKIINFQYQSQVLDNIQGKTVVGYEFNSNSNEQSWSVVFLGGNQITIQNAASNLYLRVDSESEGAAVIAGATPYKWQTVGDPGGWYQLATTDGRYALYLKGDLNSDPVVLKGVSYQGDDAQWIFQDTSRVG